MAVDPYHQRDGRSRQPEDRSHLAPFRGEIAATSRRFRAILDSFMSVITDHRGRFIERAGSRRPASGPKDSFVHESDLLLPGVVLGFLLLFACDCSSGSFLLVQPDRFDAGSAGQGIQAF
jgi:hypothetical protein